MRIRGYRDIPLERHDGFYLSSRVALSQLARSSVVGEAEG